MAHPLVNDVAFITLKGHPQSPGLMVEDISRAGVDGSAHRELQKRGEPFEMIGWRDTADRVSAADVVATLRGYQGTIVTVVDDHGDTWDNVILLAVERVQQQKMVVATGGVIGSDATVLLGVRMVMQVVTVS